MKTPLIKLRRHLEKLLHYRVPSPKWYRLFFALIDFLPRPPAPPQYVDPKTDDLDQYETELAAFKEANPHTPAVFPDFKVLLDRCEGGFTTEVYLCWNLGSPDETLRARLQFYQNKDSQQAAAEHLIYVGQQLLAGNGPDLRHGQNTFAHPPSA